MQEHYATTGSMQNTVASLVFEGVFERFPKLKVVLIEGGFAWAPALCWRMDKHWERMRKETPHVKRPPSEYVREHVWFTTQPIDEPDDPQHLADIMDWIGWDRLMFSTDYPHWDFDDPQHVFKFKLTEREGDGVPGQRQGVVRPAVSREVVARARDVAPGTCKLVTVRGREIGIFNLGGEYFALANRCPHAGGPLCRGGIGPLVQSDGPGNYRLARQRSSCAVPGTAGSSTSAPASPGATRSRSGARRSRSRSSPARIWSKDPTSPRRFRSRSRRTIWWSRSDDRRATMLGWKQLIRGVP